MLLDLIFPKTCLGCGRLGSYICLACHKQLQDQKPSCFYCLAPSSLGATHIACLRQNGIDGCMSAYVYSSLSRKIITTIKYRLVTDAFTELFQTISPAFIQNLQIVAKQYPKVVLQPIPLHKTRLKERGFNQSHMIAHHLQTWVGGETIDVLKRVKKTTPQAQTSSKQARKDNLKDAFELTATNLQGSLVLLVDDVITTGSTIEEATKVLWEAHPEAIWAVSVARR